MTIQAALAAAPSMSIPEIEAEMHARDRQITAIRDEMAALHVHWEGKNLAKQAASMAANPALAQRLDTTFDLGSMTDADLDAFLTRAAAIKKARGGK